MIAPLTKKAGSSKRMRRWVWLRPTWRQRIARKVVKVARVSPLVNAKKAFARSPTGDPEGAGDRKFWVATWQ